MKDWQFNVLFTVGVGSAVFLLIAPAIGLKDIPAGYQTGAGLILAYVLTKKNDIVKKDDDEKPPNKEEDNGDV